MNKRFRSILCGLLALVMLLTLLPMTVAAKDRKLEAYKVYQQYLTELEALVGKRVNNRTVLGEKIYNANDLSITNVYLKEIGNAWLFDITNDGVDELWINYTVGNPNNYASQKTYSYIYSYENGKLVNNTFSGFLYDHILKGDDGKLYTSMFAPKSFETLNVIYSIENGKIEEAATAKAVYVPDKWNGLDLPYGKNVYWFNDVQMSKEQWEARWNQYCSQGITIRKMKPYTEILASINDYVSAGEFGSTNSFVDVAHTDYFAAPVLWAVEQGVTGGIGNGMFGPNNPCTRAQVVTFLWAANGKPEPTSSNNPFTDVPNDAWYVKPVLWAVENGITGGTSDTTFSPDNECIRAQIVTFLYAASGKPYVDTSVSDFSDVSSSDWYIKPVLWAKNNGITGGTGPNTFGPNNICTRGQVVTFLYKAFNNDTAPTPTPTPTPTPVPTPTPPQIDGTVLAEPQSFERELPKNPVQSLEMFTYGEADKGSFRWDGITAAHINAYTDMLQKNGFELTVQKTITDANGTTQIWCFNYTIDPGITEILEYNTDTDCHLYIKASGVDSDEPGYIVAYSEDLTEFDLGLRMDGKTISLTPSGPSATAGIIRKDDGTYVTSDGRLSAARGTATIILDGSKYTATVGEGTLSSSAFKISGYNGKDYVEIENKKNKAAVTVSDMGNSDCTLTIDANGSHLYTGYSTKGFESISIVRKYKSGNINVYYVHFTTRSINPHEVEIFFVS